MALVIFTFAFIATVAGVIWPSRHDFIKVREK
jgi:hypothetical protein